MGILLTSDGALTHMRTFCPYLKDSVDQTLFFLLFVGWFGTVFLFLRRVLDEYSFLCQKKLRQTMCFFIEVLIDEWNKAMYMFNLILYSVSSGAEVNDSLGLAVFSFPVF